MPDYIPASDFEFNARHVNFITYATLDTGTRQGQAANLAGLGVVAGDMTAINTAQTTWNSTLPAHVTAAANAVSAGAAKDAAQTTLEQLIRPPVRRLQASPQVNDTERASLGITIPDPTGSPIPPPMGERIRVNPVRGEGLTRAGINDPAGI